MEERKAQEKRRKEEADLKALRAKANEKIEEELDVFSIPFVIAIVVVFCICSFALFWVKRANDKVYEA